MGKDIFKTPYQMSLIASYFNDSSVLDELVKFSRGGSIDINIKGVVAVEKDKYCYRGYGLSVVGCMKESDIGAKTTEQFDEIIHKYANGDERIFWLTIEHVRVYDESGQTYG